MIDQFGRKRCQKKRKEVSYQLLYEVFQKYFVVHKWSAVKNAFNIYVFLRGSEIRLWLMEKIIAGPFPSLWSGNRTFVYFVYFVYLSSVVSSTTGYPAQDCNFVYIRIEQCNFAYWRTVISSTSVLRTVISSTNEWSYGIFEDFLKYCTVVYY